MTWDAARHERVNVMGGKADASVWDYTSHQDGTDCRRGGSVGVVCLRPALADRQRKEFVGRVYR